jgi:hypothetical protein
LFFSIGSAEHAGSSLASGEADADASAVAAGSASWSFATGLALALIKCLNFQQKGHGSRGCTNPSKEENFEKPAQLNWSNQKGMLLMDLQMRPDRLEQQYWLELVFQPDRLEPTFLLNRLEIMLQLDQQKKVINYTAIKCKFLLISSLISQKNATTLNKKRPKSQRKGHILQDCTGPPQKKK